MRFNLKLQSLQNVSGRIIRGLSLLSISLLICYPVDLLADSLTLSWDAPMDQRISGYYLYYRICESEDPCSEIDISTEAFIKIPMESLSNPMAPSYVMGDFSCSETQIFVITSYDDKGNESAVSNTIVFEGKKAPENNKAPFPPLKPEGAASSYVNKHVLFGTKASDPENDPVTYRFDWGDGMISEWNSHLQSHAWLKEGDFCVKAQAKDIHGNASLWSPCHSITIQWENQPEPPEPGPGVYEVRCRIQSTDDDAEERKNGYMRLRSTDLELSEERGKPQWVGLRFDNLMIPKEAKIVEAYVEFKSDEKSSKNASLTIRVEDSDDAAKFRNKRRNISQRRRVSGVNVKWSHIKPWNRLGDTHRTPELKSLISEVIGRPGWKKGSAIAFIFTGMGKRTAESYDGDRKGAPLLVLKYRL